MVLTISISLVLNHPILSGTDYPNHSGTNYRARTTVSFLYWAVRVSPGALAANRPEAIPDLPSQTHLFLVGIQRF